VKQKNLFRSEAIMFILKNLNIEVKRTDSLVRKFISKRSKNVYIKYFKYRSEAKQVILKCESSEAKQTGLFRNFTISNRFASNFVLEMTKKSELSFFF
jgi:hypothetical protein